MTGIFGVVEKRQGTLVGLFDWCHARQLAPAQGVIAAKQFKA
jgi:hypothetical protein